MAQHDEPVVLMGYSTVSDWLDDGRGGPFFATRSSLDWFIKRHRHELVESGALLPRAGRSGSLLSNEMFPRAVIAILQRKALESADV